MLLICDGILTVTHEHFEHTFAHLEGLRGQISSLVVEVFLGHPLRLPITLDDSTLPVWASARGNKYQGGCKPIEPIINLFTRQADYDGKPFQR